MKKSILGLTCVLVYLITVISCQIPESITFKGSPAVRLPLGSPLEPMDIKLGEFLNPEKLRDMMGGEDSGIEVYEYIGTDVPPGVEAYIILYPIAEMELKLGDYIERITQAEGSNFTAVIPDIPSIPGIFPPSEYYLYRENNSIKASQTENNIPLFTINVADMANLIEEVEGNAFGLELDNNQDFEGSLQVKIPALGIDNYISGDANGGKLRFVANPSPGKLKPRSEWGNGEISIYVKLTGACSGTLAPNLVFDWKTAKIHTDNEAISGKFPLDNSTLADFFGDSVKFKEVRGYIYVGGDIGNKAKMSLKRDTTSLVEDSSQLVDKDHPSFYPRFNGKIPPHSLTPEFINMTDTLNASTSSSIELEYELNIDEIEIKSDQETSEKIFVDLVILLPLQFSTSVSSETPAYTDNYAQLKLEGFSLDTGDGDLFNRQGNNDDLFNSIKTVKFILSNLQNDILGGKVFFMIDTKSKTALLDINKKNPSVEFDISDIPYPFTPKFEILIEKEKSGNDPKEALFWLKRINPGNDHATFNFSLTIEVKTNIDQTITF